MGYDVVILCVESAGYAKFLNTTWHAPNQGPENVQWYISPSIHHSLMQFMYVRGLMSQHVDTTGYVSPDILYCFQK